MSTFYCPRCIHHQKVQAKGRKNPSQHHDCANEGWLQATQTSVPLQATKEEIYNPQAIAILETTKSTVIAYIEGTISMLEDWSVAVKAQRK